MKANVLYPINEREWQMANHMKSHGALEGSLTEGFWTNMPVDGAKPISVSDLYHVFKESGSPITMVTVPVSMAEASMFEVKVAGQRHAIGRLDNSILRCRTSDRRRHSRSYYSY